MTEQTTGLKHFINILETIADNKYVLGDRLVEVGVSGPNLEATLASVAMAQGELGHARLLYNWTFDLTGWKGKKPEIEKQTGKAFQSILEVNNWISLIANLFVVNTAIDIVLKAILEANHTDVASRILKLLREQKEHIIYAQNWASQLLNDAKAVREKFEQSVQEAIPEVAEWLKSIEQNREVYQEGYILPDSKLYNQFNCILKEMNIKNLISVE
jgi:ring-1,2-phenylacetyl-CoA epoxidase subunit PaaC